MSLETRPIPQLLDWCFERAATKDVEAFHKLAATTQLLIDGIPLGHPEREESVQVCLRGLSRAGAKHLFAKPVIWEGVVVEPQIRRADFGYGRATCYGAGVLVQGKSLKDCKVECGYILSSERFTRGGVLFQKEYIAPFSECTVRLASETDDEIKEDASKALRAHPRILEKLKRGLGEDDRMADIKLIGNTINSAPVACKQASIDYVNGTIALRDRVVMVDTPEIGTPSFDGELFTGISVKPVDQDGPFTAYSREFCSVPRKYLGQTASRSSLTCWTLESSVDDDCGIFLAPAHQVRGYEIDPTS